MTPARLGGPAFRSVGGDILTRAGRPVTGQPVALVRFYGGEAVAQLRAGRRQSARHCAEMALDLAAAIAAADDWRRATGAPRREDAELIAVRALATEASALAHG